MKSAIEANDICFFPIEKDLAPIKPIVGTIKHANYNYGLPERITLFQEIPTRFRTTFGVVELFIESPTSLKHIFSTKAAEQSKQFGEKFQMLMEANNADSFVSYPELEAIVTCFAPVIHVLAVLEASSTPTMNHVLSNWEEFKCKLSVLSSGIAISSTQ